MCVVPRSNTLAPAESKTVGRKALTRVKNQGSFLSGPRRYTRFGLRLTMHVTANLDRVNKVLPVAPSFSELATVTLQREPAPIGPIQAALMPLSKDLDGSAEGNPSCVFVPCDLANLIISTNGRWRKGNHNPSSSSFKVSQQTKFSIDSIPHSKESVLRVPR